LIDAWKTKEGLPPIFKQPNPLSNSTHIFSLFQNYSPSKTLFFCWVPFIQMHVMINISLDLLIEIWI
jgi:hypothetical protein